MPRSVFISHSDPSVSAAMDQLLDAVFGDDVTTFNSSRPDRGLAAGDVVSGSILQTVDSSDTFLSIWTPSSVRRPAWMSWELGVAVAMGKTPLLARALGTAVESLPMNLRSNFTPDLGEPDQLLVFLTRLGKELGLSSADQSSSLSLLGDSAQYAISSLRAMRVAESKIIVGVYGDRVLLENTSDEKLEEVAIKGVRARRGNLSVSASHERLVEAMKDALEIRAERLLAEERVVIDLNDLDSSGSDGSQPRDLIIDFEWRREEQGRECASAHIEGGRD